MKTTQTTNATHTAGPWIATEYDDSRDGSHGFEIGGHPDDNAGLSAAVCSGPDCEANARLIAAAPELLDIANRWMAWATGPVAPISIRMQLQADTDAAISKARA